MLPSLTSALCRKGRSLLEIGDGAECGVRDAPHVIQMETPGCVCLFPGPRNLLPQGALSSETLPTVVLSRWWVFLCFLEGWGLGKPQSKVLMDRVDSNFPKDYSETLHVAPRDWYLHLKRRELADVATHFPEVISLKASWLIWPNFSASNCSRWYFPFTPLFQKRVECLSSGQ